MYNNIMQNAQLSSEEKVSSFTLFKRTFAPYATSANVFAVIWHCRVGGVPFRLTQEWMVKDVGIPEGNAGRVSQALRFLRLTNTLDCGTQKLLDLAKATLDEYPSVLERIIRSAYHILFNTVEPSKATEEEITSAFENFLPESVRPRMVSLFLALCKEARIITLEGDDNQSKDRGSTDGQAGHLCQWQLSIPKRDWLNGQFYHWPKVNHNPRYQLLHDLIDQLPEDGTWTKEDHSKWTDAMEALICYLVKEV